MSNLLTLWIVRGDAVSGWELSAATFRVLALDTGWFSAGVHKIVEGVLNQRRPVFTGGESLIFGLIPGLL